MSAKIPFHLYQHDRREHVRAGLLARPQERKYKGSSGSNTVQTQSGPPAEVLANYNKVFGQAQNVAAQPYQPYTGATVAGFTPLQQSAFSNLPTAVNAGQPFINQASQDITNASTALDPSHFAGTVDAYQSPYTQKVVDATQAEFANQNAQQQEQIKGNAVSAGAWGGDRSGVAQGITAGQEALAQAPVIANLYNTGFQNATNAAQSNAWLQSQAGFGMANLGQEAQQQGLTGINAELGAGATQQQMAQQELNVPYQAYQAATAYPFQTTNWLEGMATGTGGLSGTQGSTTTPGPSAASQLAGAATTGVGIAGQMGAFKGAGAGGYSYAGSIPVEGAARGGNIGLGGLGAMPHNMLRDDSLVHRAAGGSMPDAGVAINVPSSVSGFPEVSYHSYHDISGATQPHNIGGMSPIPSAPNLDNTEIPQSAGAKSNGMLGGGNDLLQSNTGTTSTTTDPNQDSTFGTILKTAGEIAANVYGGPAGGMAAHQLSNQVHFDQGGEVAGLSPVPIRPRGFDTGGDVAPGLSASVGGNPMLAQAAQSYNGLPTEQLQELASRFPPGSPQGSLVQRALQMRHANPGSNPAQPTVPSTPGLGPSSGAAPMGQAQAFARGGEAEDDDALPDLVVPEAGPSVPGGLAAGLSPGLTAMQPAPEQMLTQHAMAMNKSGSYVPPPPDLAPVVMDAAQRHGVDPKALAWMLSQESHWNPNAYNPSSGTVGLGQFKPATAREEGIDPRDPVQAIHGAAHYLSKQLARSGGDYETAIGHYGTFSTGHGRDADNAVRGQFRAFMQGAKYGGAVRLADGGDPGYRIALPVDGYDLGASAMDAPVGGFAPAGITDGSGGSMAPPPTHAPVAGLTPLSPAEPGAAPPTTAPVAGFGPQSGSDTSPDRGPQSDKEPIKASPWEAVMAAGLGMMAGTSPHALTNIGTGGLAGMKDWQQQKQLAINDQIRRDTADTNAVWRKGQLAAMGDRTQLATAIAGTKAPLIQAQTEAAQARAAALEAGKPKYQYQAVTQPDPDDPSKNLSGVMQLDPSGQVPPTFIRTDTNPNKPGGAAGMGGRESVYFNRVTQAGNAATAALANIMELPTTASTGIFGGRTQGPSLFSAGKESLTNTLTTQGVQDYNTMITGVARNLATLESAGLAPGGAFTNSMNSVTLKEGDTEATKMRKLAEARQIIEKNLEPNLSNPHIPPEQKQMVQGIISQIQKVVPFTQHDVTQFQASKAPTMADFMKSSGLGGQQQPPPQGGSVSPKSAPGFTFDPASKQMVPNGHQSAPSWKYNAVGDGGATLHSNDGKTWFMPNGSAYAP